MFCKIGNAPPPRPARRISVPPGSYGFAFSEPDSVTIAFQVDPFLQSCRRMTVPLSSDDDSAPEADALPRIRKLAHDLAPISIVCLM